MFCVYGLVIMLIIKDKTYAEEDFYNSNGWKPLSSEKILNLYRKFTATTDTVNSGILHEDPVLLSVENIRHIEENTENLKPRDINRELMGNDFYFGADDKENQFSLTDTKRNFDSEYLTSDNKIMHELEHRRQAKYIIENQKETDRNIIESSENKNDIIEPDIRENVKVNEDNITKVQSTIYEVTEPPEALEIKDLLEVQQSRIDEKKPYFKPDIKTTTEKNLSNVLLNILGNYNIRINDDLTNYAISRNKYGSNPYKHYNSVPIKTPPKRNSENHFPIDPYLAVFLSNYGFYLPGFYGFPGNYYNIYGYLASNNIHNNKPFGAYKIYSDTDSSH